MRHNQPHVETHNPSEFVSINQTFNITLLPFTYSSLARVIYDGVVIETKLANDYFTIFVRRKTNGLTLSSEVKQWRQCFSIWQCEIWVP